MSLLPAEVNCRDSTSNRERARSAIEVNWYVPLRCVLSSQGKRCINRPHQPSKCGAIGKFRLSTTSSTEPLIHRCNDAQPGLDIAAECLGQRPGCCQPRTSCGAEGQISEQHQGSSIASGSATCSRRGRACLLLLSNSCSSNAAWRDTAQQAQPRPGICKHHVPCAVAPGRPGMAES